jgi:hypothetical protein
MNEREALDELSRRGEQPTLKPQTLSGQQMQKLAEQYNAQLQAIYGDIKLRELALEQAIKLLTSPVNPLVFAQTPEGSRQGVVDLIEAMHAFLVEAAQEEKG